MSVGRVVLMHGRSLQSLAAARSLAEKGVDVIGCDETPLMALSFSRYARETFLHAPLAQGEREFVDDLAAKLQEYQTTSGPPLVLMPINQLTYVVSRYRDRFGPNVLVAAPSIDLIERVMPKDRLVRSAEELDVPIPKTWIVTDESSLEQAVEKTEYPCLLKLCDGTGGIGIERVSSKAELQVAFSRFQDDYQVGDNRPALVQQLVEGEDYCVTALCEHGEMKANMVYRNLRTYPSEHGFGVLRETVEADELVRQSENLLRGLNWHGLAEIDFRWDKSKPNSSNLIEVNPRFWAGLFQSIASGVDYPWLLYQLTVEGHVSQAPPPEVGVKTRIPLLGLMSCFSDDESDDEDRWSQLQGSLGEGWDQLLGGNTLEALRTWGEGLIAGLTPSERVQKIQNWLNQSEETEAEMLSKDDPLAVLGLFYVLGSLVRTGKLPEELRRSGDS